METSENLTKNIFISFLKIGVLFADAVSIPLGRLTSHDFVFLGFQSHFAH